MSDPVTIEIRGHREHAVVTIVGSLQGDAAHTLRRTLGQATGMYSRVVLDVAGVSAIDPACLRELVAVQAALARKKGLATIVGLPRILRQTPGATPSADVYGVDRQLAELQALEQVEERLRDRFPLAAADTVHRVVADCHHEFDGRPIRDFIPVLVETAAAGRLRLLDLGSAEQVDDPRCDDDCPCALS